MSFRVRTALCLSLLCVTLLSAAAVTIYLGTRQALLRNLDAALLAISRAEVASALDSGQLHLHEGPFPERGYQRYAQICRPGGPLLARSANLEEPLPRSPLEATREPVLTNLRWRGSELRAVFVPCQDGLVAQIATPLAPVRQALGSLVPVLGLVLGLGGALAASLSFWLAGRLTAPLSRLAEQAGALGADDLGARILGPCSDQEVEILRQTLNALLEELQASFEAQQDFLADASHELRTPLTNLMGQLEVALRRPRTPDEYVRVLELSLHEARRLARLVGDLLTLSRLDRNQLDLHPTPVDVVRLARECLTAFEPRARQAGVQLALEGPPEGLRLELDGDRLRQILDNLLDNAIRYAPSSTAVEVRLGREASCARIEVVDHGPGLDPSELHRIFQRFYRPDPARQRETGGSGLGLAIARSLGEALGGHLDVESHPGQGARFWLELPAGLPGA